MEVLSTVAKKDIERQTFNNIIYGVSQQPTKLNSNFVEDRAQQ